MEQRKNRRGYKEYFKKGHHLNLNDLKEQHLENNYLFKTIPPYPRPEFHVSHLKHDTDRAGLEGIRRDGGFKNPFNQSLKLLWWSLAVKPEDVTEAERRFLEKTFPDRTEEQAQEQQSFLGRFATSPAFKKTSRLGSYRFTFPLEEVLQAYSDQFCVGGRPILRVFETVLYKQEVMYSVLVHSPTNQEQFSEYPLLTDDPNAVCAFRDGRFIWRPEAMCGSHNWVQRPKNNQMDAKRLHYCEFYVWDHVSIALHVDREQVLKFDAHRLRENLKFCQLGKPPIVPRYTFECFSQAKALVKELWSYCPSTLMKERSLQYFLAIKTLIIGDFAIEGINATNLGKTQQYCFPTAEVPTMKERILHILAEYPLVKIIIVHVGVNDVKKRGSEVLKHDLTDLLNTLGSLDVEVFISSPVPRRGTQWFSRLLDLRSWLSAACPQHDVGFINNFNSFWKLRNLFMANGINLKRSEVEHLRFNLLDLSSNPSGNDQNWD